ncbi:MAG: cytochrome P450 [Bacteroidota bacterium]
MATTTPRQINNVPLLKALGRSFQFVQNPIPVLSDYFEEYGTTFSLRLGNQHNMVTIEPDLIQHVLQKQHRRYCKSEVQTEKLQAFVGQGLLTSDGAYWLKQRRLIQPGFHRSKLSALTKIMQEQIDSYLKRFDQLAESVATFDISHKMMELAFDVVARSLFSSSIEESQLQLLAENITAIQAYLVKTIRLPFMNPWYQLSGQHKFYKKLAHDSKQVILQLIEERKASEADFDDLLDMLLSSRYEDTGEGMSDQQLLDESLILFVAGHETSAVALAWTIYLLAQHPWAVDRIREELVEVLEGRKPRFEDLPQLSYTLQVIQESMRIYPPAWITDRKALVDDVCGDIAIKKDTIVVPFIYGVHHHPQIWPAPDRFDPDRFTKEAIRQRPSYAYLPFGGGPRLCIGNNFALMEMQLIIAALLDQYDIELVAGQEINILPLVTLRPKEGIQIRLKKRLSRS